MTPCALVLALAACLAPAPDAAPERSTTRPTAWREVAADRWLAEDKARHLALSFAATAFGYGAARFAAGPDEARGLAVGGALALGVAKELLDARAGGPFSVRDLAWDAVGVALGFVLIRSTN